MIFRKIFFIVIICFSSCSKEESDGIPAFINIDSIFLNDNITDNITDAWVYVNDNLQGVYELPVKFPILEEGDLSIHHIKLDEDLKKIIMEDIIVIGERIRDLKYIKDINKIILFMENSPGIGILSL